MPGLYDRLQDHLKDDQPTGLSPLDLTELPDAQRKVMFFMLREARTATGEVEHTTLETHFADSEVDDLGATLDALTTIGWLIVLGEASSIRYRVNFRHKRSSKLSVNMWAALTGRLAGDA
ncbi:MAG: hypothetical protein K8S97_09930 [Anaerolineae bacterium]|nr:hypothetical protein [Anaerolineae bacterium]